LKLRAETPAAFDAKGTALSPFLFFKTFLQTQKCLQE
jgi:hypothetical protein